MTTSHGRAGRRGRSWLSTALVASGFCLAASGARPALACHIHHDKTRTAEESATTATTATMAMPSESPTQALDRIMKSWDAQSKAAVAPTSAASPAAQVLTPPAPMVATSDSMAMPSVRDWHRTTAADCTPPPPTCTSGMSSTAAAQVSAPLNAPAALLNPPGFAPTPAPEPSTILTALAMAGAFAWRRRSTRRGA